jgi:hypothetical protein
VHCATNLVDYLPVFEAIFEKALTCVSGTQGKLFDEKKQRSKISCQGLINPLDPRNFMQILAGLPRINGLGTELVYKPLVMITSIIGSTKSYNF